MSLMKKIPLLIFLSLLSFFLKANDPLNSVSFLCVRGDTSILNDSSKNETTLNDPRKAFKDLFVSNSDQSVNYSVQLNPRAISFVQDYMNKHTKQLNEMKDWGRPYFDLIERILSAHGLPAELKYLAVIESDLKSGALSWAGAVGPWQFMPATARKMGLKVNSSVDERTDYFKSTQAAAKYLSDLFSVYGDWLLVIAAYNGGGGNVDNAIKRSGSRNFWDLQYFLPEESRNHVKKFIATHYTMEGNGGITTVTKDEAKDLAIDGTKNKLTNDELIKSRTEVISGKYHSLAITKIIVMDIAGFNRYNPNFDREIALNGTFQLRLPADKMDVFDARKNQILEESIKILLAPLNN